MTKEILKKIEGILASNSMIGQESAMEALQNEFLESTAAVENAEEGEDPKQDLTADKSEFQKLINHFQIKLANEKTQAEKKKEEIYAAKKNLVSKLQDLIQNEQEIGKAIQLKKELQTEWDAIEDNNSSSVRQLNQQFHKLIEDFNYNLNLYKAIKDHDFKRNQQIKEEILLQLNELLSKDSNLGETFRVLQKRWFDTGPVKRESQDEFWQKFKDASQKVIDKLAEKKEAAKSAEKENLAKKEAIVAFIKNLMEEPNTKERQWRAKTDLIIEKQKEWKQIGFVPKSQSAVLWDSYKACCDLFFKEKSAFYEGLKEEHKKNKNEKISLCDKAAIIVNDAKMGGEEKTRALTQLQRNWKNIGQAHPRDEQKLWKKFQDTCNLFFVELRKSKDEEKVNIEQSLSGKKNLIDQLQNVATKEEVLSILKQWFLLDDHVRNLSSELNNNFNDKVVEKLAASGMNKNEISDLRFATKIEAYKEINNADLINKELYHSKDQISKLEEEKAKFENNLGFFKHTKKDNPMLVELLDKVEKMTKDIEHHKKRLSQIRKLMK
ncbi:MAG: DUF349 domain-containing protein [Bacteroidetes bacterium]|nr:DUF349 domain-containing protein [Bacteroidota bacterium]